MNSKTTKLIAGACAVCGIIFGFIEKLHAPIVIVSQDSPDYPGWLSWSGWFIASAATLAYIVADLIEHRKKERMDSLTSHPSSKVAVPVIITSEVTLKPKTDGTSQRDPSEKDTNPA